MLNGVYLLGVNATLKLLSAYLIYYLINNFLFLLKYSAIC